MDSYHDRPGVFIAPANKVQEIEDLYAKAIEDPDETRKSLARLERPISD